MLAAVTEGDIRGVVSDLVGSPLNGRGDSSDHTATSAANVWQMKPRHRSDNPQQCSRSTCASVRASPGPSEWIHPTRAIGGHQADHVTKAQHQSRNGLASIRQSATVAPRHPIPGTRVHSQPVSCEASGTFAKLDRDSPRVSRSDAPASSSSRPITTNRDFDMSCDSPLEVLWPIGVLDDSRERLTDEGRNQTTLQ